MANRTSVKTNINSKIQPTVTTAIHRDVLNSDMADNLKFREDVAVIQTSTISAITCDFAGKDRIDLTRTGGTLSITLANIGDGEEVGLYVSKTAGQSVTFINATDATPVKINADALQNVLYIIKAIGANYFARAWVETVLASSIVESNALTITNKFVSPGTIPIASDTQAGVAKRATALECNALSDASRFVVPARIPKATPSQAGIVISGTSLSGADISNGVYISPTKTTIKNYVDTQIPAYFESQIIDKGSKYVGDIASGGTLVTITHNKNVTGVLIFTTLYWSSDAAGNNDINAPLTRNVTANSFDIYLTENNAQVQDIGFHWMLVKA